LFDKSQTTLIQYPGGRIGADYRIPDSVTNIAEFALSFSGSLTNVTIATNITSIGYGAFNSCSSLTGVYFQGTPPSLDWGGDAGFSDATVYYLPGTAGWGTTFGGRPTALWLPLLQTTDGSFGVRTNQFGFNITWASGQNVVVEACTNPANPVWLPLSTNTLSDGAFYFTDSQWANYPSRFYRLRSP
jgi:hypothetical protein